MKRGNRKRKVIESLMLYLAHIALGISFSITGPTLLDLQEITDSETDEISIVLIVRNIGGIFGALAGGVLISRINPWLLVSVSLSLSGALEIVVPMCTNLVSLGTIMTLCSAVGMIYDTNIMFKYLMFCVVASMQVINIWGNDHGPWMQALHCLFGIGALLGPLIATPFLSPTEKVQNNIIDNVTDNQNLTETLSSEDIETEVKYAYLIAGAFLLLTGLAFLILYATGSQRICIHKKEEQNSEELTNNEGNKILFITFVVLVFIFYWMYCNLELSYSYYLTSYTVDELGWSKTDGASLTSVFWGTFTFGRIVGIFIVKYLSTELLLCSSTALTILSLIPVVFFVHVHVSVMWISTVLFGLFISTIYASGLTFSDMYVSFSGGIGSIFVAAGSLGALTGPIFVVPLFNSYGMQVFVVLLLVSAVLQFVVFLGALFVGKKKGKRKFHMAIKTTQESHPLLQSS